MRAIAAALLAPRALRLLSLLLSRVAWLSRIWFRAAGFNKRVAVVCISMDEPELVAAAHHYYGRLGVDLGVFLDGKSSDRTKSELEERRIPYRVLPNPGNRHPEPLLKEISALSSPDWLLKMDNDEILNVHGLLETSLRVLAEPETDCFAIRRSWVLIRDGSPYVGDSEFIGPDYQVRLVRHREISFHGRIHTPGFDPPPDLGYLSLPSRIYHFDWVVRSQSYRQRKVQRYAETVMGEPDLPTEPDAARERVKLARWYLPEESIDELELSPVTEPEAESAASRFNRLIASP